jgi:hypothetical protein
MSQEAKKKALEFYKDFTQSNIVCVSWKTDRWDFDEFVYVLTKIGKILYGMGIISDWTKGGGIEIDEEDPNSFVALVNLYGVSSSTDTDSECDEESESESDDPVAEK